MQLLFPYGPFRKILPLKLPLKEYEKLLIEDFNAPETEYSQEEYE